jgi:hypothetical protein
MPISLSASEIEEARAADMWNQESLRCSAYRGVGGFGHGVAQRLRTACAGEGAREPCTAPDLPSKK